MIKVMTEKRIVVWIFRSILEHNVCFGYFVNKSFGLKQFKCENKNKKNCFNSLLKNVYNRKFKWSVSFRCGLMN